MVCILSTQSRKVRHKHTRRFLALPLRAHHLFLPTSQVMDRAFIPLYQLPHDSLPLYLFIYPIQSFYLKYFIQFLYFTLIESLLLNCPGFVQLSYEYDNSSFNLEDLNNLDADDRDVLGSSQLGEAPPLPSQEPAFQTPEPTVRPSRQAASP